MHIYSAIISCVKEKETEHYYQIINNSSYKISLHNYFNGQIVEEIILLPSDNTELTKSFRGFDNPKPPSLGDSIEVIFSDTLTIIHGSTVYEVNKNLKNIESYIVDLQDINSNNIYFYKYNYIFTDEDYQEALEHQ